jgi:hypothetical protein
MVLRLIYCREKHLDTKLKEIKGEGNEFYRERQNNQEGKKMRSVWKFDWKQFEAQIIVW